MAVKDVSAIQVRQCVRPECALRYPVVAGHPYGERCPRCGASTRPILGRRLVREPPVEGAPIASNHLEALLDNIRSAWNVGSMFRTADGLGVRRLTLCGLTPTPDNPKVAKTSLGAEASVAWEYAPDGVKAACRLRETGRHLWALEQDERSVPLTEVIRQALPQPLVLVVGNEIAGVDLGILELCERVVSIPMRGSKRSFNAAVAFGIAMHSLMAG